MFRKFLASVVSAAILMVGPGPLAAQTISRGPVAVSVIPAIGTGLVSPVPGASSLNMPTAAAGALTAPTVSAAPLPVAAVQSQALAATDSGSPLAVIRSQDPAVGVDKKGAALNALFENSMSAAAVDGAAADPVPARVEPVSPVPSNTAGIVLGLTAVVRALESKTHGSGYSDYWIHHFSMRRNMGNAVAGALRDISRATDDKFLAFKLGELADDLLAAPQTGSGYADYWVEMCSLQDKAFDRVAQRLRQLNNLPRT